MEKTPGVRAIASFPMRLQRIRTSLAALCAVLLVAPTFFFAFGFDGLYRQAYAQSNAVGAGATGAFACGAMLLVGAGLGVATVVDTSKFVLNVPSFDFSQQIFQGGQIVKDGFLECIVRAIARAILQDITQSVVAWANSGFNGNPSFVQDFRGFMRGVGDKTIGEFIAGSPLSFLCSPFQFRIRIAIARKFARREAPLCTLSQIASNIEGFTRNFNQGGWPAFLEFTVAANNNPFGGHLTTEALLSGQVLQAQGTKQFDLTLGKGFLSFEEKYECGSGDFNPETGEEIMTTCTKATTPGTLIEGSVRDVMGSSLDQLELADHLDEMISAIITGLIQKVLYGGFSNYGGGGGYSSVSFSSFGSGTSEDVSGAVNALVEQIDLGTRVEERVRTAKLQSVSEIERAQDNLSNLSACWEGKVRNNIQPLTFDQETQARNNAANASSTRAALEPRKAPLQTSVAARERTIAQYDTFRTRAFGLTALTQVQPLSIEFLRAQGTSGVGPTDVVGAETELAQTRSDMEALDQSTSEKLTQCYAFPATQTQ